MADFRRRNWVIRSKPSVAPRMIVEEITPSSGWTDFPEFHCLLVDLPGFKKDDIKLNVDESGTIKVSGRRKVGEEKQVHFEKTFDVPEDGDIKSMSMIFEGDTLTVRVPKVAKTKKDKPNNATRASNSDINKDTEESNISALSSSSVTNRDKLREAKSPSSRDTKENESKSHEGEKIEEAKSLASSSITNEKPDEYLKEQNDSDQGKEKQPESPHEEKITEKPNEQQKDKNDRDQGKEKEPENPVEENIEKSNEYQKEQNDHVQGKDSSGQGEKNSKTSAIVKIMENKGILIASIISFTLGVLLSQKIHSSSPPK